MNKTTRMKDPFTCNLPQLEIHGEPSATCGAPINSFIKDNLHLKNKKFIIVHGKGTGVLKKTTHEILKHNKNIKSYYIDGMNDGQTIVETY